MNSFIAAASVICCLQLVKFLNLVQSETNVFLQNPKPDDEKWNERPGRDQKSLLIVFDTSGSMNKDLEQLRGGAQDIVNLFASRKDQPIYNYVLSLFNDPCKFWWNNKSYFSKISNFSVGIV